MNVPFNIIYLNVMMDLQKVILMLVFSLEKIIDEHFDHRPGVSSFDGINKNENEVLLECSEDVPFSPLRQSYTPLPMNQSNGNELDNHLNVDIIDIKLNDQEMMHVNDDDPHDDSGNMDKEDVVVFTITEVNDGEFKTVKFFFFIGNYESFCCIFNCII